MMMILFTRRAVDQQCKMTKIDVVQPRRDGQVEVRKGNQIRLLTGWAKGRIKIKEQCSEMPRGNDEQL